MESARRRIPDERAWAAFVVEEALASEAESHMRLLVRSRPRRSIDSVRWV